MSRRRFAVLNLTAFAVLLPLYLVFERSSPLWLQIIMIALAGGTGWFGILFLILSFADRR